MVMQLEFPLMRYPKAAGMYGKSHNTECIRKKAGKIRVVCDYSAGCDGHSLNQQLLQGPDLTNNLTEVLCRF